jgi:hypothetical protein
MTASTERQNAVDELAGKIAEAARRTDDEVSLTLPVARLLLDCARKGLHKGEGKGGIPHSRDKQFRRGNIYNRARMNYQELRARGVLPDQAKDEAAEEARLWGDERYNIDLSVNTIKRHMHAAAGRRPRIVSGRE